MPERPLTDAVFLAVSDDLDALRGALDLDDTDLGLPLARLLAACSGTLRAQAAAAGDAS